MTEFKGLLEERRKMVDAKATLHREIRDYGQVQLEVKAANHRAQAFYQQRGMSIQRELVGYYASGLGYMMRGPLRA